MFRLPGGFGSATDGADTGITSLTVWKSGETLVPVTQAAPDPLLLLVPQLCSFRNHGRLRNFASSEDRSVKGREQRTSALGQLRECWGLRLLALRTSWL